MTRPALEILPSDACSSSGKMLGYPSSIFFCLQCFCQTTEPPVGFFNAAPEAAKAAVSAMADPLGLSEQLTLRPETDTSRPKPEVKAEPNVGFLGAAPMSTKAVVSTSSDPLGLSENLELQPQRGFRLPTKESKEKKLKARDTDKARDKDSEREKDRDKSTDKVKVEPPGFFGVAPDATKSAASTSDPLGLSENLELQPQRGFRLPAKAKEKDAKEPKEKDKDTKKKKKKKKKDDESELEILGFSLY